MNRDAVLEKLKVNSPWDVVIIGGGATGIGTAVDAASRGYKTLLVEQADFGKGTSSRSTKLAHGGVRYLQQGNISLVLEALKERGIMRRNAPHLVKDLSFVVPTYDWWEGPFYGIGLKLYDLLAGQEGLGTSEFLSKEETIGRIPTIETKGLRGGIKYHDGQFDDTRLLINLAQTAQKHGASLINYMKVVEFNKKEDEIDSLIIEDQETKEKYTVTSKAYINATGVFTDFIRKMDSNDVTPIMTSSQGVHIVLDKSFLPSDNAIMVPHTDDGRIIFATPWHDKIIVGTTDTPVSQYPLEPKAQDEEIEFLLTHIARYLTKDPTQKDIKSVFVGLRPLVKEPNAKDTSSISREHQVTIAKSGLISISGGKWTTYRKMAEDVINQAIALGKLPKKECKTEHLLIHGYQESVPVYPHLEHYGSDEIELAEFLKQETYYSNKLHQEYEITEGEVIWAIRKEMARTVEDFLARRTRLLFLDAETALAVAPKVAELMAEELDKNDEWITEQINIFKKTAQNYLVQ